MSGWPVPTPAQDSFMPPPVPVLSTTGALKLLVFANCSATAVEKGKTVEEPTMRIWSRVDACTASAVQASREQAQVASDCLSTGKPTCGGVGRIGRGDG